MVITSLLPLVCVGAGLGEIFHLPCESGEISLYITSGGLVLLFGGYVIPRVKPWGFDALTSWVGPPLRFFGRELVRFSRRNPFVLICQLFYPAQSKRLFVRGLVRWVVFIREFLFSFSCGFTGAIL